VIRVSNEALAIALLVAKVDNDELVFKILVSNEAEVEL
jgi:hypothetical protein